MDSKTKFQEVLEHLKTSGWTDEQLVNLSEELAKTVFNRFYTEVVEKLTDEDLDVLEKCSSQEEANIKIKELYKLRIGRDADEEAKKFYDDFATKFLQDQQKTAQ